MESKLPKRKSHVTARIFRSGERILFDLKSRQTYKLNDTALEMWSLCDGLHSCEDIIKAIVEKFDVEESIARRDIKASLNNLLSMGLIEI